MNDSKLSGVTERALSPPHGRLAIQDASAWILRAGVLVSAFIMLVGLGLSLLRHPVSVEDMQHRAFDGSVRHLWQGVRAGRGQAIIELGIYALVLTPILRVFTSMVLFLTEERDTLYTVVTFLVLVLTLAGLLLLK